MTINERLEHIHGVTTLNLLKYILMAGAFVLFIVAAKNFFF